MRPFVALLLGVAFSVGRAAAPTPTPAESVIRQLLAQGVTKSDLSIIPTDQRDAVIARLRVTAERHGGYSMIGNTSLSKAVAELLLLRIGDTVTIERMIGDYRPYDSMASWDYLPTTFRRSKQPKLVPYLADDFYAEEDPNQGIVAKRGPGSVEFAISVPSRAVFSGVIVTDIIKSSGAFSPQMEAWANQAHALRLQSPERFVRLMRRWWEVNKAAFARAEYGAVVPLNGR